MRVNPWTPHQLELRRIRDTRWRKNNPGKVKANRKKFRLAHPERVIRSSLAWRGKLSKSQIDDYVAALAGHIGLCEICGTDKPAREKSWSVDHCHTTGRIRGVLCHCCNTLLGMAKDNPRTLLAAVEYLRVKS
jgi:hypothetical protein